jgi:hypothetical protein
MGEPGSEERLGSEAALHRLLTLAGRAWEDEARRRSGVVEPQAYDDVFRRAADGLRGAQKRLARDRKLAQAAWASLQEHPQARRLVMIRNNRRLRTWGLYRLLLDGSRGLAPHDARAAAARAELALAVAEGLDPAEHGDRIGDFKAAAFAALAEAKRRLSDHRGAWALLEDARASLGAGTGDPLERAEVELVAARLLHDAGRDEESALAFRRARNLLRTIGDARLEAAGDLPLEVPHDSPPQRRLGRR